MLLIAESIPNPFRLVMAVDAMKLNATDISDRYVHHNSHYSDFARNKGYDDEGENPTQTCTTTDGTMPPGAEIVCALPLHAGDSCSSCTTKTQYGFDYPNGQCKRFRYSGLGGNINRFDTLESCNTFCLGKPVITCTTTSPSKYKKNHGLNNL